MKHILTAAVLLLLSACTESAERPAGVLIGQSEALAAGTGEVWLVASYDVGGGQFRHEFTAPASAWETVGMYLCEVAGRPEYCETVWLTDDRVCNSAKVKTPAGDILPDLAQVERTADGFEVVTDAPELWTLNVQTVVDGSSERCERLTFQ